MPEDNGARAERIREAIVSEEYGLALRLWEAWVCELRATPVAEARAGEFGEAQALIEWSRGVLAGARARRRGSMAAARAAGAYAGAGQRRASVIRTCG